MSHVDIQTIRCKTAERFIAALSPNGHHFGINNNVENKNENWIFRGQRSQIKRLLPSAYREGHIFPSPNGWITRPKNVSYHGQVLLEYNAMSRFFQLADDQGLPLPEDSQKLRELLKKERWEWCKEEIVGNWPDSELLSSIGLAQHYGIPTRLLDWTKDPYVAAYFAVEKQARINRSGRLSDNKYVVVWAISETRIKVLIEMEQKAKRFVGGVFGYSENIFSQLSGIRIVTAPSAGNPNLKAQKGLFTFIIERRQNPEEIFEPKPIESALWKQWDQLDLPPGIKRVLLPVGESNRVLRLLARIGVSAASLYPGYAGVVQGMNEEEYWAF